MTERPLGFGRRAESPGVAVMSATARPVLDDEVASGLLPERPKRGHKGDFGKVLVIAGSLDYAGAALLVCRAAGRAGAGLVTLAVPESLQPLFAAKVVEATTMALPEDDLEEVEPEDALARILDHEHDSIVLGPGLRPGLATRELVRSLLAVPEAPPPPAIVLDAEALRSLASLDAWWEGVHRPAVLTPHAGEFARLRAAGGTDPATDGDLVADDDARAAATADAAARWHQVVVLKGARTVIAAPDGRLAVAPFENPALASGGTGDVLAGAIGALLAQGLEPYDAARLGVYLHGLAAEAVSERLGDAGLLASDLPGPDPDGAPSPRGRRRAAEEGGERRLPGARRSRRQGARRRCGRRVHRRRVDRRRRRVHRRRVDRRRTPLTGPRRAPASGSIEARLAGAGLAPLPRTAWLEIDLDALAANLAAIRAGQPSGVRVEPVVKADAYGHGAIPVARALEAAGADGFSVATLDEALALRGAGIESPILVLYPIPPDLAGEAAAARVALTAGDPTLLERLLAAFAAFAAATAEAGEAAPGLAVHLEVETGLGRGGFPPGRVAAAAESIAGVPGVRLAGVWSHLQDPGAAQRTGDQVARFAAAVEQLAAAGLDVPARHFAASGALVLGNAPAGDAVRPGLVTYGIAPDDIGPFDSALASSLRPVMALRARPVRVADLPAGHGISYGPTFTTARPSRIATLPLGYGDGWPRALSNRAEALVRGVRVPLVGQRRDGRRHGRRDRRAGATRSPSTTNSRSSASRATARSPWPRWRDRAPRTPGRWSRSCPRACPGCTMRRPESWRSGP